MILPAGPARSYADNEKLNPGILGLAGIGGVNAKAFHSLGENIAVPDHNHAYISVYAMKHGVHVYCLKPLTASIHEARVMTRAAAETKVVTQMGTQTSAEPRTLRTVELIQSGALGDITGIHMTTDRLIWPQGLDRPEGADPVPSD